MEKLLSRERTERRRSHADTAYVISPQIDCWQEASSPPPPICALAHVFVAVERRLGENGVSAVTLVRPGTKGDGVLVNETRGVTTHPDIVTFMS